MLNRIDVNVHLAEHRVRVSASQLEQRRQRAAEYIAKERVLLPLARIAWREMITTLGRRWPPLDRPRRQVVVKP